MIFKKTDYFEKVFYCKFTGYKVGILSQEKYDALEDEDLEKEYTKYTVKFRPLSWGEHGKLRAQCHRTDPETNQRIFDYDSYSVKKLAQVVDDWDLKRKDVEGAYEKIDPTPEAVGKLHPLIATHMLALYEDEVEMSQEEEKN
jgi:hypothetical protein